jgi:ribose 5-phosphate isomerase A
MTVGLGTGTTAAFFHEALAARIRDEGLKVIGVATSGRAEDAAIRLGIPLAPLTPQSLPDLTIDGADELTDSLQLIKGGGGALLREKLVARASGEMVVIADASKRVSHLGAFPLPIVAVPFAVPTLLETLRREFEVAATWRTDHRGIPLLSDDGLAVLDLPFGIIRHPALLEERLRHVPGVVEIGLFLGIATRALLAHDDGSVEEFHASGIG